MVMFKLRDEGHVQNEGVVVMFSLEMRVMFKMRG